MDGVRRGEIEKLLVLESLPKPVNFTGGMDPLTYGGSFTLERVLGTVPVEEDGSARFKAPAGKVLYFQALDEDFNELQRMRSVTQLQPGETRSCVGCHESRASTPPTKQPIALTKPAHEIQPHTIALIKGVLEIGKRNLIIIEDKLATGQDT